MFMAALIKRLLDVALPANASKVGSNTFPASLHPPIAINTFTPAAWPLDTIV